MKISPKYPVIRRTQNYGKFVDHVRCTEDAEEPVDNEFETDSEAENDE